MRVSWVLKKTILPFGFVLMLATALPLLRAQTGSEVSAENPAFVLALLVGACALVAGMWSFPHL